MRKAIDQLSKNLAGGMSRRKALWHFVTGLGAVGAAGALTGRRAYASNVVSLECQILCNTQQQEILTICYNINGNTVLREVICSGIADEFLSGCLEASSHCRSGSCAEFTGVNSTGVIDTASYSLFVGGGGDFVCAGSGGRGSL
jgi:hypothetical protein